MNVLGMPLFDAINTKMKKGVLVSCVEVRSKKGVVFGEPRVIRCRASEDCIELCYSIFQVDITPDKQGANV